MVKDRRNPERRSNSERHTCVVHVRFVDEERELLGRLADRKGVSMAEYLRHMMRIGARSAVIAHTARQANALREARKADKARQAKERERQELDDFLATREGQAALAEVRRQRTQQAVQGVQSLIRREHSQYVQDKAWGRC